LEVFRRQGAAASGHGGNSACRAGLMHVDPVVRARAIVADCLARGAADEIAEDAAGRLAPPASLPAQRAAGWRPADREVAVGIACIMFTAYIIFYMLMPR
jgi:hypothetical protein